MKMDLLSQMVKLQKDLRKIENLFELHLTSVLGDFDFLVENSTVCIKHCFCGSFVSEMTLPLEIFISAGNKYRKIIEEETKKDVE